jgi:tetratricopeptide (TPR) repeat protein
MSSKAWAIAVFLIIGIVKLPLEQRACEQMKSTGTLKAPVAPTLRENLGQAAFAASLGGLRSLVASVVYLQGYSAFERGRFDQVESLYALTTQLQPRYPLYWDDAATRMALDAASHYLYDDKRPRLYRNQLYQQHFQRGLEFAEQGVKHLPDSKLLHQRLGQFYSRLGAPNDQKALVSADPLKAGQHYMLAYKNGALPFTERFAAYEYAKLKDAPAQWREAYDILRRHDVMTRRQGVVLPTTVGLIKELGQRLGLPASPQ